MPKLNLLISGAIAVLAFSIFGAEEPPKPETKEATPAAEKKAGAETPAAQPAPAGAAPKFPLQSEWFIHIADLQPDDKTVGDVEEAQQLEHHALEDILVALKDSSDEHLKKSRTPDVSFKNLMREAEKYRGHVVQFRGLLEVSERFPLPENKSGVTEAYRGQTSTIYGELYSFISMERPNPELIKHPVRITGVFMKRYAFKNRQAGEKLTWTPMIIIKNVEPYSEADVAPSGMSFLAKVAITLAVVLLLGRLAYRVTYMKSNTVRGNPFTKIKQRGAGKPAATAPKAAKPVAETPAEPPKPDVS